MITVTETDFCKLDVNYIADKQEVQDKIFEIVVSMRDRKVTGFRSGKASDTIIRRHFKKDVDKLVKQYFVNKANDDIIFETKIKPIGETQLKEVALTKDDDFSCTLSYLKRPDFELKAVEYELPEFYPDQTVEDLTQQYVEQLRKKHATYSPYEENDFVTKGDKLTISYELSNGQTEDGQLHFVNDSEFDTNLYGMKPDDVREFELSQGEEKLNVKVTLHMGMKGSSHPLNDDLAKSCGVDSVDLLMQSSEAIAKKQIDQQRSQFLREQLKLRVIQDYDFKIPEWLIDAELKFKSQQNGTDLNELDNEIILALKEQAEEDLKFTLVLDKVREEYVEAALSDKEALDRLAEMAAQNGIDPNQWVNWAVQNGVANGLIQSVKNDFALDFIISKANIEG